MFRIKDACWWSIRRVVLYGPEPWALRKFWNVVLAKDVEAQLDRSREKWSITSSQGEKEYPTYNKKKEDWLDCSHIA
jgi:hypothetical protein